MSDSQKNKFYPEKTHLIKIDIIKCHIDSPFEFDMGKIKGHEFNMEFDLGFNMDDKLVKADFKLTATSKSEGANTEEALGDFHFVFIYNVENLSELAIHDTEQHLTLNGNLGNALASITYSTTRGILFTRLKGTSLENFILPVINPNELIAFNRDNTSTLTK